MGLTKEMGSPPLDTLIQRWKNTFITWDTKMEKSFYPVILQRRKNTLIPWDTKMEKHFYPGLHQYIEKCFNPGVQRWRNTLSWDTKIGITLLYHGLQRWRNTLSWGTKMENHFYPGIQRWKNTLIQCDTKMKK